VVWVHAGAAVVHGGGVRALVWWLWGRMIWDLGGVVCTGGSGSDRSLPRSGAASKRGRQKGFEGCRVLR
jgi:hypothetical protein